MYNYLIINSLNTDKIILDKINGRILELKKINDTIIIEDTTKNCFKLFLKKNDTMGKHLVKTLISNDFEDVNPWEHPLYCKRVDELEDTLNYNLGYTNIKLCGLYNALGTLKTNKIITYDYFKTIEKAKECD